MRKSIARPTTLYTLARRADLTLSRHAGDVLVELVWLKKHWRKKLQDKFSRQGLVENALLFAVSSAAGSLIILILLYLLR